MWYSKTKHLQNQARAIYIIILFIIHHQKKYKVDIDNIIVSNGAPSFGNYAFQYCQLHYQIQLHLIDVYSFYH